MNEEEKAILYEIISEEIKSYLESGYKETDYYIIILKRLLKKLNLEG